MEKIEQALGQALKEARKAAGLTQEELGLRSGIHPTYVSRLERGLFSPTVRALCALAGTLNTTGTEILRRAEERTRAAEP